MATLETLALALTASVATNLVLALALLPRREDRGRRRVARAQTYRQTEGGGGSVSILSRRDAILELGANGVLPDTIAATTGASRGEIDVVLGVAALARARTRTSPNNNRHAA